MSKDKRSNQSERDLIRRLTSYIDASSLTNTAHWKMSRLRREAVAYLEKKEPELLHIDAEGQSAKAIFLSMYPVLDEVAEALDQALGDTDITHLDAEELREQHPVQWACTQVNKLLQDTSSELSKGSLNSVERNAARYRWLKANEHSDLAMELCMEVPADDWDAAIDADMRLHTRHSE